MGKKDLKRGYKVTTRTVVRKKEHDKSNKCYVPFENVGLLKSSIF